MNGLQLKYFVLKPAGDDEYARASRWAMHVYARKIKGVNPDLASDLREWIVAEERETFAREKARAETEAE